MTQRSYQYIANETNSNIVQLQKTRNRFIDVKGMPFPNSTLTQNTQEIDYMHFTLGNQIVLQRKGTVPFYVYSKGHDLHQFKRSDFGTKLMFGYTS